MKVVNVSQMREIEAALDASGIHYATLMQNAGLALAERISQLIADISQPRVTFLIGPGNNGGDGLVAAQYLAQTGRALIRLYLLTRRDDELTRALSDKQILTAVAEDDRDGRVLKNMVASADILVDALFGIGVRLPLRDNAARLLRAVNQALHEQRSMRRSSTLFDPTQAVEGEPLPKTTVIAVDCPSGLDCDSGAVDKNVIMADETITFIAAKRGQFLFPGAEAVGQLWLATAGAPPDFPLLSRVESDVITGLWVRDRLPTRPIAAHKGIFGRLLVLGGCHQFIGAVGLAALAAYQIGVGLVTIASTHEVTHALAAAFPEPTWWQLPSEEGHISVDAAAIVAERLHTFSAIVIGPGMGQGGSTAEFLRQLFALVRDWPPLLLDADALNIISQNPSRFNIPPNTVMTPHPGEMKRLMGEGELTTDRWEIAQTQAQKWSVVMLLKGAHTIVADRKGRSAVLPFKNPALAKAGTGDVLAGLIGGLLAQGVAPFESAAIGAYVHGLAATIAAQQGHPRSLLAHQVATSVPLALAKLDA